MMMMMMMMMMMYDDDDDAWCMMLLLLLLLLLDDDDDDWVVFGGGASVVGELMIGWLIDRQTDWLIDWLMVVMDWLIDWFVVVDLRTGWLMVVVDDWLIDWLIVVFVVEPSLAPYSTIPNTSQYHMVLNVVVVKHHPKLRNCRILLVIWCHWWEFFMLNPDSTPRM